MKLLVISFAFLLTITNSFATACKDANFNGLEGEHYDKLQYHHRFENFFTFNSPAPMALFEAYFNAPDIFLDSVCFDMKAHYFTHKSSQKEYVMFTTHDDYCDGGNTFGLVIDMQVYKQQHKLKESVVGEIGDSEFYCVK